MNTSQTLTLKLPAEALKVIPNIIRAKVTGQIAFAKKLSIHFKAELVAGQRREASERARQADREYWEAVHRSEQEALKREAEEAEARWQEEVRRIERIFRDTHFYLNEDGQAEFLPRHSSNKGFRRFLSEVTDERDKMRFGIWGAESMYFNISRFLNRVKSFNLGEEYARREIRKVKKGRKPRTFRDYN